VDDRGDVTVWTTTQGIFAIRSGLASSLGIPISKINVIGMTIGGGFGAKFGMVIHPYAVILAQKTGRPVKIVMDRHEEFLDARPAPGCRIWLKTAARRDGTILGRQAVSYWNTGTTSGASLGQTSRIRGVYKIPSIQYDAYGVYTNEPGPDAYRAPGAPQVTFASEAQLDRLAEALGMDPVELRLKNMAQDGDSVAGGRPLTHVAFKETLRAVADKVGWKDRKRGKNRGWGVAVGEWTNGAGPAGAMVSVHEDGSVRIFSGLMDISGTDTAMAQIAAEVLGVPFSRVSVVRGDTNSTPYITGSGGSVVTFSVGNAVKRAAEDARNRVLELAAQQLEVRPEDLVLSDGKISVRGGGKDPVTLAEIAQASLSTVGGPIVGKGTFAREPSHAVISAQIAEVEVDPGTGNVKLLRLVGAQDCGTAVNPVQVEGQMEGGAVQSASWGLMEETKYSPEKGNLNPHLLDYRIPTALDLPALESVLVENPSAHGPFGVKGVGEPPITPTMAAIANAVYDAAGVRINDLPITPERVLFALKARGNGRDKA
jgi:CO/xanthine dehydrogenase Mo-binding subunit